MLVQGLLFPVFAEEGIRFELARGAEIKQYIPEIIKISDVCYSVYPYLYDGTQCNEEFYMSLYGRWSDGRLIMVFDGDRAVGYAIGGHMKHIPVWGHPPLIANGCAIDSTFLFGEIALLDPYRGKQIGRKMVNQMENFARDEIQCKAICLIQIDEAFVLISKPENYHSYDGFWLKQGYKQHPKPTFNISWRNVNDPQESDHTMFYWIKQLL